MHACHLYFNCKLLGWWGPFTCPNWMKRLQRHVERRCFCCCCAMCAMYVYVLQLHNLLCYAGFCRQTGKGVLRWHGANFLRSLMRRVLKKPKFKNQFYTESSIVQRFMWWYGLYWLVVSPPLKNTIQLGLSFPMHGSWTHGSWAANSYSFWPAFKTAHHWHRIGSFPLLLHIVLALCHLTLSHCLALFPAPLSPCPCHQSDAQTMWPLLLWHRQSPSMSKRRPGVESFGALLALVQFALEVVDHQLP